MAINSPINLQLPQSPRMSASESPSVHAEFQMTYNAIRNLWVALSGIITDGGTALVNWGQISGDIANQQDLVDALNDKLSDAASDGNIYGRKDGQWVIIPSGGGGVYMPVVTGEVPPVLVYSDDGGLIYTMVDDAGGGGGGGGGGGTTVNWGEILGDINSQTDLRLKLDALGAILENLETLIWQGV